ncbi:Ger(x)C family spore germination protein [Paenibacillus campinasensis]|uniref:Ger(X)C family spore germination protein n=1 Tax=Paenibacillus campinasensis TaxID=66347 RepID=A0ABW9T2S7_9BACL|nr:Ger(x)C family spore germination protein [Paenibacillus campinasensis]MUG67585.1 Ger(x)C family spore germination protein [Paenibacillus campinasensis]
MRVLKVSLTFMLFISILILSGCGFRDIDLRLFVVSIGIDVSEKGPHMQKYSFKMAIPTGDPKSGEVKSITITQESESIAEAIREVKSKVDKELDFGHCRAVLYGEAYARKSIRSIQEWTVRRRDIQLLMFPALAVPTAEAVMKIQPPTERIAGNALVLALSEDGTESPFITRTFAFDLNRRMAEIGEDPVIPVIAIEKNVLNIDRVALMDKEKVKLILNRDETRLYNMLDQRDVRTNFRTVLEGEIMEMNVDLSRARYRIVEDGEGQGEIRYNIRLSGTLEEKQATEPMNYQRHQEIEQAISKEFSKNVTRLLQKIQKSGLDPLGFGLRYAGTHWNNDTEMDQWGRLYPRIKFKVNVRTVIKSNFYKR